MVDDDNDDINDAVTDADAVIDAADDEGWQAATRNIMQLIQHDAT